MPTYTYTHGSGLPLDRVRFLVGDHRGTSSDGTGWLFSDEELTDCLTLAAADNANNSVVHACLIALQCRANREALGAGVDGITDTSYRPTAILNGLKYTRYLQYGANKAQPMSQVRADDNLPGDTLTEF